MMKQKKQHGRKLLALVLALSLCVSLLPAVPAFALESDADVSTDTSADADSSADATTSAVPGDVSAPDVDPEPTDGDVSTPAAEPALYADEDTDEPATVSAEGDPFTVTVQFDGQDLTENRENTIANIWSGNVSKTMTVQIERNSDVAIDPNKQYVLCMKTTDVLYFNGLPDAGKITGADEVAIVQNTAPTVNKNGGKKEVYDKFSSYSGEIRIKLNPNVNTITIPDIGISYDIELIGHNRNQIIVSNPIEVKLVSVDNDQDLGAYTASTSLHDFKITSLPIATSGFGNTWKAAMSNDSFKTTALTQSVTLGKDGSISYYYGTNGIDFQVYKTLTVVVNCPYVIVNGETQFLDFSTDDIALTENRKSTGSKGYNMAKNAEYDSNAHTITYYFENVYLGGHTALLYTPDFKWPDALKDDLSDEYEIQGASIQVTEQTNYLGSPSTLQENYTPTYKATFLPERVDVYMKSSYESSGNNVAKRYIYKDVTRENGIEGAVGFFDIHNNGSKDSSLLKIEFNFNTASTGATYYVTKVRLPAYGTTGGTDVTFTLTNGSDEKSGTRHYANNSTFDCKVTDLRTACGADSSYYIKSISYQTYLQAGIWYHLETAHLNRNRLLDAGLFFGYLEGEIGTTASATMTISSADNTAITKDAATSISSTETSTVSEEDYVGMSISAASIDDHSSQSITAGSTAVLSFSGSISAEEYSIVNAGKVNGYHTLRNGIFYVCLPDGVSIAGLEQVTIKSGGNTVQPKSVATIGDPFQVDEVNAQWWAIQADGLNTTANKSVSVSILLSTSEEMSGINWDFANRIVLRANGQQISWAAASTSTTLYNTTIELNKSSSTELNQLASYLESQSQTSKLGIEVLNGVGTIGSVKLNIARAEAKLDVTTQLTTGDSSGAINQVALSSADTEVNYAVTINGVQSGYAENFNYYIPIVHKDSALDASMLVSQNEIALQLKSAVAITAVGTNSGSTELPFYVFYTTAAGLTYSTIQDDAVQWVTADNVTNYSAVTAIRIATKANTRVEQGESYQVKVTLSYAGDDFERQAGAVAEWKSFGHYTYNRNGATTTNTYPSDSNSVQIHYTQDLTDNPMMLNLNTAADKSNVDTSKMLTTTFAKEQSFTIKKVTISNGTQLISNDPSSLTGAAANSQFRISFNINNSRTATTLSSAGGGSWTVSAGESVNLQAQVFFSRALTDVITERYVDVVLGNDDVDITCRIKLDRTVTAASADGSRVAVGDQFQVPQVGDSCTISGDSAFTALYVVKNFVPGNFTNRLLKWQKGDTATAFPTGTTITMMEVDENSMVTSYWYCKPTGNSVDLSSFTRMGGTDKYSYDTAATSAATLRYLFVVDFGGAQADSGDYQLIFDATAKDGAQAFTRVPLSVTLVNPAQYTLSANASGLSATMNYKVTSSGGNDSYTAGRSLALVLTGTGLPQDARIRIGDATYAKNSKGCYVIPLDTSKTSVDLTLVSDLFPDAATDYEFTAQLYLSPSLKAGAPLDGTAVATTNITLQKAAVSKPALKVSGTQTATADEWKQGQKFAIELKNVDSCTVTVTAYSGVSGTQKVTDLLSSVSGVFDFKDGVGTYKSEKIATGMLTLSSTAKPGTYRLSFEVKDASGTTLLTVPYYIIVR